MKILLFLLALTEVFSKWSDNFASAQTDLPDNVEKKAELVSDLAVSVLPLNSHNRTNNRRLLQYSPNTRSALSSNSQGQIRLLLGSHTQITDGIQRENAHDADGTNFATQSNRLENSNSEFNYFNQWQNVSSVMNSIQENAQKTARVLQTNWSGPTTTGSWMPPEAKPDSVVTPGMFFDPEQLNKIQKQLTTQSLGQATTTVPPATPSQSTSNNSAKKSQWFRSSSAYTFRFG